MRGVLEELPDACMEERGLDSRAEVKSELSSFSMFIIAHRENIGSITALYIHTQLLGCFLVVLDKPEISQCDVTQASGDQQVNFQAERHLSLCLAPPDGITSNFPVLV